MPSAIASPIGLRNNQRKAIAPTISTARTPMSGMICSTNRLGSSPGGVGRGVGPCITTATPGAGPAPWRASARRSPYARPGRPPRDAVARSPRALPHGRHGRLCPRPSPSARAPSPRTPSPPVTARSSTQRTRPPPRWGSSAPAHQSFDSPLVRRSEPVRAALLGQEALGEVEPLLHLGNVLTELLHLGDQRVALLWVGSRSPMLAGDALGNRRRHGAEHPKAAAEHEKQDERGQPSLVHSASPSQPKLGG